MCHVPLRFGRALGLVAGVWTLLFACSASENATGASGSSAGSGASGGTEPEDAGAGTGGSGAGSSILVPEAGDADAGPVGPQFTRGQAGRTLPAPEWNCGEGCFIEPSVSTDAATLFEGAAGTAPELVYPLAGSMHPLNLPDITFHWTRADATQQVFRLHIEGSKTYDLYFPCTAYPLPLPAGDADECVAEIPESIWAAIALDNYGAAVTVELSGANPEGTEVGSAEPIDLHFSPYDLVGGLYYWSTGIAGTYRLTFGQEEAQPFILPNSVENPSTCSGCHAVSRDGKVIAFTAREAEGALVVTSASDATQHTVPYAEVHDSSMIALNPDGSRALVAYAGKLELRDTSNGAVLGVVPPTMLGTQGKGYFPEFSADGSEIVLTLSSQPDSDWAVRTGAIAVLPYSGGNFGNAEVIVPEDGDFHFYPTFSPDGEWIAFASAPVGLNQKSYNQSEARLRLASRDGSKIFELGKATHVGSKTTTMPKFSPFALPAGDDLYAQDILFLTFNSKMNYGVALKNDAIVTASQQHPQLWMAAIDLREVDGEDPSFAPIWLPFQDIDQNNHLGYWTSEIACIPGGCGSGAECGGEGSCVVK
jgi:hypothetical protein